MVKFLKFYSILILPFAIFPPSLNAGILSPIPYLQQITPHEASILWDTHFSSLARVCYGTTPEVKHTLILTKKAHHHHRVTLRNLRPNTRYYYKIYYYDLFPSEIYSFKTAPLHEKAFSFAVLGDSGNSSFDQYLIALELEQYRYDFLLHTGDIVYPKGKREDYFLRFFFPYEHILHRVPIYPTLGNHDAHHWKDYVNIFHLPKNNLEHSERYYSFDWSNAQFFSLDSVFSPFEVGSLQYQWLIERLSHSQKTWKFVYFHVPIVGSMTQGIHQKLKEVLMPLLEQYQVDAVFMGHHHLYERTRAQGSSTLYIITGGGGADLDDDFIQPNPFSEKLIQKHHFLLAKVRGRTFTLWAIDEHGKILDTVSIEK
ncbi:MAG: metallophosphoesterase [Deltaproteobacteria bacterium]|nr:metallophosphoesterase [Deltaproteobacteria bacterium]